MSDRPTPANRDIQQVPTNVVETLDGEIKTFSYSSDAKRYAEKHGGKAGQLIHGEII